MPKVSIIVPCWGVEKYLDKCVESLVYQTLSDIEIILVDDESPDRVPEMCDEWAKKDGRIKVVHKKNAGLGMACNSGLDVATGEYVAFCDSDDWVELNTYEALYSKAKEENLDAVYSSFKFVDMNGVPLLKDSISYSNEKLNSTVTIHSMMKGMIASKPHYINERQYQASAKVALYRKRIIDDNGIHFVSERKIPSEDLLFNLNFLSNSAAVSTISEKFYNYRINPASITHSVKRNAYQLSKTLMQKLMSLVGEYHLGEDGLNRVYRLFIAMNRSLIIRILNSNLSPSEQSDMINEITKDDVWKNVWISYPIKEMPIKHKLFLWLMCKKSTIGLRVLSLINKIKK